MYSKHFYLSPPAPSDTEIFQGNGSRRVPSGNKWSKIICQLNKMHLLLIEIDTAISPHTRCSPSLDRNWKSQKENIAPKPNNMYTYEDIHRRAHLPESGPSFYHLKGIDL
jgi:hypothetical protein